MSFGKKEIDEFQIIGLFGEMGYLFLDAKCTIFASKLKITKTHSLENQQVINKDECSARSRESQFLIIHFYWYESVK